jgi:predicted nucleic acid-binding protein
MPDRIIAATALHLGLPLISRDRKIQLSGVNTIG